MSKTVYEYLRAKYPAGECVIVKEVADSTIRRRYLDFMVINLWESRGLSIIGFEVKSYRSDWLNELKNPAKQELHAPFCDYFYLLTTDVKVAKIEEIPDNWGWMTIKDGKLHTIKKAPKQQAKPMSKAMMISIIRRADSKDDFIHKDLVKPTIDAAVQAALDKKDRENNWRLEKSKDLEKLVNDFKEASGIDLQDWRFGSKKVGHALKLLMNHDLTNIMSTLNRMNMAANSIKESTEKAIAELAPALSEIESITKLKRCPNVSQVHYCGCPEGECATSIAIKKQA